MTGCKPPPRTCDDYEPEPLTLEAEPDRDQCGIPGHGWVWLQLKADAVGGEMFLAADCDYLTARAQLTLEQAESLAASLTEAVAAVNHPQHGPIKTGSS